MPPSSSPPSPLPSPIPLPSALFCLTSSHHSIIVAFSVIHYQLCLTFVYGPHIPRFVLTPLSPLAPPTRGSQHNSNPSPSLDFCPGSAYVNDSGDIVPSQQELYGLFRSSQADVTDATPELCSREWCEGAKAAAAFHVLAVLMFLPGFVFAMMMRGKKSTICSAISALFGFIGWIIWIAKVLSPFYAVSLHII